MRITASAPGKVVLSGEYAVLDGAAAICIAVNRRARVSISRSDDSYHLVSAPGVASTASRFTVSNGHFEWLRGGGDYRLLESVWHPLAATLPDGLVLSLDTQEFVDTTSGTKFGIGSSAALVVALTAALNGASDGNADVGEVARSAHRDFQRGAGSGLDVACSFQGGVVEYRMGDSKPVALAWPNDLAFAVLWSGVSANTGARLSQLDSVTSHPSRAALSVAAGDVVTCWQGAEVLKILDALRRYTEALREFNIDHELGIFDAGHAELTDAAVAAGVVYKPCGAGGGDVGIVLADNESAIESFVDIAAAKNFKRLQMTIDQNGVQSSRDDH